MENLDPITIIWLGKTVREKTSIGQQFADRSVLKSVGLTFEGLLLQLRNLSLYFLEKFINKVSPVQFCCNTGDSLWISNVVCADCFNDFDVYTKSFKCWVLVVSVKVKLTQSAGTRTRYSLFSIRLSPILSLSNADTYVLYVLPFSSKASLAVKNSVCSLIIYWW